MHLPEGQSDSYILTHSMYGRGEFGGLLYKYEKDAKSCPEWLKDAFARDNSGAA